MGETWATWAGWVIAFIAVIASVVAIKGTVRFDVNEWQKERRNQKEKGSIRDSYVFVIESLERQEVGLWTSGVSRCGFRRRAG